MRLGLAGPWIALTALVARPASLAGQGTAEAAAAASIGYQPRTGDGGTGVVGGFQLRLGFRRGAIGFGPEFLLQNGADLRIRALAGVLRIYQRTSGIHPFLVAGLGAYTWQNRVVLTSPDVVLPGGAEAWQEANYFSGSLGVGVALGVPLGEVQVEARWHRSLSDTRARGGRSLLAVAAGLGVSW